MFLWLTKGFIGCFIYNFMHFCKSTNVNCTVTKNNHNLIIIFFPVRLAGGNHTDEITELFDQMTQLFQSYR